MSAAFRTLFAAIAALGFGLGIMLAVSHPVQPTLALGVFLACVPLFAWKPQFGILALPAMLPALNFSPWTGWLIVDEFDLLVLAVVAGGNFRIWRDGCEPGYAKPLGALFAIAVCLIGRGLSDVSLHDLNWFSGYTSPLNALRVSKSLLWIALLLPVLADTAARMPHPQMIIRFFWAALLGSVWAVLTVFRERALYPGLLDTTTPYRTVGWFWEMHHGGAALDVYLVLVAPLFVWAWQRVTSAVGRLLLGTFILAFTYACLTTFSRGVIFAVGGALIIQWILQRGQKKAQGSRTPMRFSSGLMVALVCVEVVAIMGTASFLNSRLQETRRDFGGRLAHWEKGLGLLESPTDWLFGIGLGRIPSRLIQVEDSPGGVELGGHPGNPSGLKLYGPKRSIEGGFSERYFALSQRFDPVREDSYRFWIDARGERGAVALVEICVLHLLYPARCSSRIITMGDTGWQKHQMNLSGSIFGNASWWHESAYGVLLMSVVTPDAVVEIGEAHLEAGGRDLLKNARLNAHEGRWFPQSFHFFLPWHIDNFYLELLIETGILGVLALFAVVVKALSNLANEWKHGETFPASLLSALGGVLAIGLVVSVADMPRVATLVGMFFFWATATGTEKP